MPKTNTYRYRFAVQCPADDDHIIYALEIQHTELIPVEQIRAACLEWKEGFQEAIADDLFERFGGKQKITATHRNVEIETLREAAATERRWIDPEVGGMAGAPGY